MYDNMFIHFNDTLRKMLWEPPCYGVLRTEINNRIKNIFFSFPNWLPNSVVQWVRAFTTNL